jgi:hypothetical protein
MFIQPPHLAKCPDCKNICAIWHIYERHSILYLRLWLYTFMNLGLGPPEESWFRHSTVWKARTLKLATEVVKSKLFRFSSPLQQ